MCRHPCGSIEADRCIVRIALKIDFFILPMVG